MASVTWRCQPVQERIGHAGLGSARPVRGPTLRKIPSAVDERPAVAAGIGQEDPDLTVLNPPGGPAILPLHAGGLAPLLDEAGFVQDQHAAGIAQALGHIAPQIVADDVRIPAHPAQKLLHPVRRPVPGRLGQLPSVLALDRRHQPPQIRRRPPSWLDPPEPRRQTFQQGRELGRPGRAAIHRRHGFLLHGDNLPQEPDCSTSVMAQKFVGYRLRALRGGRSARCWRGCRRPIWSSGTAWDRRCAGR